MADPARTDHRARAQHRIRHITSIRIHNLNVLADAHPSADPADSLTAGLDAGQISTPPTSAHLQLPPGQRSRRISTSSAATPPHVSETFDAGSAGTIREEDGQGVSPPPPPSSRAPARPGMNLTRSRSRLVIPKHVPSPALASSPQGYTLASPTSPHFPSAGLPDSTGRRRSTSISSVRSGMSAMHLPPEGVHRRERAATLSHQHAITPIEEQERMRETIRERLVRCFVALSVISHEAEAMQGKSSATEEVATPKRPGGIARSASAASLGTRPRKSSAPASMSSAPPAPAPLPTSRTPRHMLPRGRSGLGMHRSPSLQSSMTAGSARSATLTGSSRSTSPTSPGVGSLGHAGPSSPALTSKINGSGTASVRSKWNGSATRPAPPRDAGKHRSEPEVPSASASAAAPTSSTPRKRLSPTGLSAPRTGPSEASSVAFPNGTESPAATTTSLQPTKSSPRVPFFVSHIHRPSSQPVFGALDQRSDFAPWTTVEEAAGESVLLDVWVERRCSSAGKEADKQNGTWSGWERLQKRSLCVDLSRLRELRDSDKPLPDNTLVFTFANSGQTSFFLPIARATSAEEVRRDDTAPGGQSNVPLDAVMQRSLTQTKMRRGVDLHVLHQMVHLGAVVRGTERELAATSLRLNRAVEHERPRHTLQREMHEKKHWLNTLEVGCQTTEARCNELRNQLATRSAAVSSRRAALAAAQQSLEEVQADLQHVEEAVALERSRRVSLLPKILAHRARSSQILDYVFPILPLDPQTLLYAILGVPLPIPQSSEMTAPPVSLPSGLLPRGVKVDEDSTATALGFVALVVQTLSGILDHHLVYPVTCAGSRSLVRDPISIINGPRSFPLYAKGVEKYRYEYAVFLLNKNIEMMMVDARIRIEDIRHTLPNLKTLLLTVSADMTPGGFQLKKRNSTMLRPASPFVSPTARSVKRSTGSPVSSGRPAVNSPTLTISQAAAKLHFIMGD